MYDKECDFIVKVSGSEVTKLVSKWEVKEVDDGMSSCNIIVVNPDMKLSGVFQIGAEIEVVFGTPSDMSNTAKLDVVGVTENYNNKSLSIEILGQDIIAKIDNKSQKGMFKKGTDAVTAIKDTVEAAVNHKASVQVDLKSPSFNKDMKLPFCGTTWSVVGELANMCQTTSQYNAMSTMFDAKEFNPPASAPKSLCLTGSLFYTGVGRESRNGEKPDRGKDQSKGGGSSKTDAEIAADESALAAGGKMTYDYGSASDKNSVDNNRANAAQNASKGNSVRGDVTLLWSPGLRAKKGIELVNLGPENSGGWYVQTCIQGWEVGHGGSTKLHVMRSEPEQEQKEGTENKGSVDSAAKSAQGAMI
jgi:hypothetical protein